MFHYRTLKKYSNIIRDSGFSIPLTYIHDRSKDRGPGKVGYDDEVLLCL